MTESKDGMWYLHVKHDNCLVVAGGRTGKNRMSIGPYSRKAGIAKMSSLLGEHQEWHRKHSRHVLCIIKLEREPLDV